MTTNARIREATILDNLFCGKRSSVNYADLRLLVYMLQSRESSWRFPSTLPTILNLSLINLKRSSAEQLKSLHFILAQSGTSIEFRPLSFKLLLSSPE